MEVHQFGRRRLRLYGSWQWLLSEFAIYYGVSDIYTKLRNGYSLTLRNSSRSYYSSSSRTISDIVVGIVRFLPAAVGSCSIESLSGSASLYIAQRYTFNRSAAISSRLQHCIFLGISYGSMIACMAIFAMKFVDRVFTGWIHISFFLACRGFRQAPEDCRIRRRIRRRGRR